MQNLTWKERLAAAVQIGDPNALRAAKALEEDRRGANARAAQEKRERDARRAENARADARKADSERRALTIAAAGIQADETHLLRLLADMPLARMESTCAAIMKERAEKKAATAAAANRYAAVSDDVDRRMGIRKSREPNARDLGTVTREEAKEILRRNGAAR